LGEEPIWIIEGERRRTVSVGERREGKPME
jgi:hypothetical protein